VNSAHRVVVAGSTFGRMYLRALRLMDDVQVTGLLARGGDRSRRVAEEHGIPLLTSPEAVPEDTDLVCVAVRAGSVGGAGTDLATRLLERGIPVLHELPMGRADVGSCLRAARRGGTDFAVANLYHRLPAVCAFRAACLELLATEDALAADAHLSIQPAYALASLLGEIGLTVRPTVLSAREGGTLVSGTLGSTPCAVRYATVLDGRDTDNDVRFPAVSVHTRSGTLTLTDVHGQVLWTPTLHLSGSNGRDWPDGGDPSDDAAMSIPLHRTTVTPGRALGYLWPHALARNISAMLRGCDPGEAQRAIRTAQLWEELTRGVGFPEAAAPSDPAWREALTERLRAVARDATADVDTDMYDAMPTPHTDNPTSGIERSDHDAHS
jgi:pyochelin biosynthetic protein PchG